MITLNAQMRDKKDNLEKIRIEGKMPAVFYGKKEPATSISLSTIEFLKAWKEAGESSVISIETPNGTVESLIHEVDIDPITSQPRHADFYVFEKGQKVEVEVPIDFEGVSPAVKDLGGSLVKVLHALKVEASPKDLPHNIIIDISKLVTFDDQILAGQIKLPAGVELIENPEEVVALVSAPREEKEEESAPVDLSAIEVAEKGKKEDESEASEGEQAAA